jgi:CubicO group peptidase (beta-lactamase class C family)
VGKFLRDEIAEPLGVDFWIGLPEEYDPLVATMIFPEQADPPADFFVMVEQDPESIQSKIFTNDGGHFTSFQTRAALAAEIPAAGGVANARGLAGIYAPLACGGTLGDVELVDKNTLARMGAVSSATGLDKTLLVPMRFSLGFTKAIDNRRGKPGNQDTILMSEDAFGCPGFGGSIGLADPVAKMSFGYCMNNMGPGTALNPRGQSLLDATYRALGYKSNASGRWIQ